MKCDFKTMAKIGAVIAGVLAIGFFALSQIRPAILGLALFALFALCPISMFFAMRGMKKGHEKHNHRASCSHNLLATERNDKK